jgi:hypothetical protein
MANVKIDVTGITLPTGEQINFLLPMQVRDNNAFLPSTTPLLKEGSIFRTDSIYSGIYCRAGIAIVVPDYSFTSPGILRVNISTSFVKTGTVDAFSWAIVTSATLVSTSSFSGIAIQSCPINNFALFLLSETLINAIAG